MNDYIKRGDVIDALACYMYASPSDRWASCCIVRGLSAADVVERKHGEWVINERGFAECTECKFERIGIPLVHRLNFCPNCGADMKGD